MLIPLTLVTARLTLRQFAHDDWRAMHEHYCDPECTKYTFRRPLSEGESWRAMASMVGHWQLRGFGPYAVVESERQTVIGAIGLWYPNDWPEPEIKWAMIRKFWGMGYASEAVRAVQRLAALHFNGKAPISLIDADNSSSIRLALSVGATFERQMPFRGLVSHVYRHPIMSQGET